MDDVVFTFTNHALENISQTQVIVKRTPNGRVPLFLEFGNSLREMISSDSSQQKRHPSTTVPIYGQQLKHILPR